jgi:hypothetical protein
LEISAVVTRWLNPSQSKLGGDVLGCQLAAALAGTAALQQVEREETHMGANLLWIDGSCGGASGLRQARDFRNKMAGGLLGVSGGCGQDACGYGD